MNPVDDFIFLNNKDSKRDWFQSFDEGLGTRITLDNAGRGRWPTMKAALNLFLQRGGGLILETGCQREPDDWGAGSSTTLFYEVLSRYKAGQLISVDNTIKHLRVAASLVPDGGIVTLVNSDSVKFLNSFNKEISLLYLDSMDYPVDALMDAFGVKGMGLQGFEKACVQANSLSENEVLDLIGRDLIESQEHCLKELEAAGPNLSSKSIVLIDDNNLPGGGKGRLAREYLQKNGWQVILDYHQSLWIKL